MPRFSVIIPVYKVEKYLDRCIASVTCQTFGDLEIILVDDGSPDSCPAMCDGWAHKDSRIKVIHKANGGLGFARNSGIEIATGEYISFIDSDDTVSGDMFEQLNMKLTAEPTDICYFGWKRVADHKVVAIAPMNYPASCYGERVRDMILPNCFGGSWIEETNFEIGSVCFGVFKKALFADPTIRFESERAVLSEDILFTIKIMAKVGSVGFISKAFYNYYCNYSSLTKSYRADRFEKTVELYQTMLLIIATEKYSEKCVIRAKSFFLSYVIACLKQELSNERGGYDKFKAICTSDTLLEVAKDFPLNKASKKRRFLFWAIKRKHFLLARWMVNWQIKQDRNKNLISSDPSGGT